MCAYEKVFQGRAAGSLGGQGLGTKTLARQQSSPSICSGRRHCILFYFLPSSPLGFRRDLIQQFSNNSATARIARWAQSFFCNGTE